MSFWSYSNYKQLSLFLWIDRVTQFFKSLLYISYFVNLLMISSFLEANILCCEVRMFIQHSLSSILCLSEVFSERRSITYCQLEVWLIPKCFDLSSKSNFSRFTALSSASKSSSSLLRLSSFVPLNSFSLEKVQFYYLSCSTYSSSFFTFSSCLKN